MKKNINVGSISYNSLIPVPQTGLSSWNLIPDYGKLNYCNLQGQMALLEKIRLHNQLQHLLVNKLKQVNWLMGYISSRLKLYTNTKQLGEWYQNAFQSVGSLSVY